jgi:hypothetical protein
MWTCHHGRNPHVSISYHRQIITSSQLVPRTITLESVSWNGPRHFFPADHTFHFRTEPCFPTHNDLGLGTDHCRLCSLRSLYHVTRAISLPFCFFGDALLSRLSWKTRMHMRLSTKIYLCLHPHMDQRRAKGIKASGHIHSF